MKKYLKESLVWAFIAIPYIYLATIWNQLPEQVPTHFTSEGIANDWSAKTSLLFIPASLGIGIYLLMLIIPLLDPKNKIQHMGGKYSSLRSALTVFISLLATYLLYLSKVGGIQNPNILFALIGVLFVILGNYFQAVRPNYFIGIRTPWALESEEVWKSTHRLGGSLWIGGGILIIILALFINNHDLFSTVFNVTVFLLVIVPIVFSYLEFQKEKALSSKQKSDQ